MKESIGMNKSKTSNISYLDEKEKRKLQFMDSKIMDRKVDRVLKCIFFSVICVVLRKPEAKSIISQKFALSSMRE